MPEQITSVWIERFANANARYNDWATRYKCSVLEQYFRGFQWNVTNAGLETTLPYTLNMIYSTVKIKLANYLVHSPKVIITPKPSDAAFNLENAIQSAQIKEAFINSNLPNTNFSTVVKKAARDSFFRFGIVEVGYSANFIENPNLDKPEYASDKNPQINRDKVTTEPKETLESERIYFKYINPKRFRIGSIEGDTLDACNWVGYYDFVYIKDLAKAVKKDWKELETKLGTTAFTHTEDDSEFSVIDQHKEQMVKIWHIWDNRAKERKIITDVDGEIQFTKKFERLPLFDLRWDLEFDGFYPIPPTFQWISPQDEINEAREQARNHRRRFTRKYQARENSVSQEEVDKFTAGPDGSIIWTKQDDAIRPIASPDLGKASDQGLVIPKDDFNLVSATSQEARGIGDRVTATQAKIIEGRSGIREAAEVEEINAWMAKAIKEAILIASDRFIHPVQIELANTSNSQMFNDYNSGRTYSKVYPEQLDDGFDFNVLIDVATTSPNQNEIEKTKFLEFLAVLQNFPQLSLSPLLIREAAYRTGYRNELVIREMQNAALLQMIGQASQNGALGQGGGPEFAGTNGGQAQRITEQTTPPTTNEIENQLNNQLVQ